MWFSNSRKFRPMLEWLEARLVPSMIDHSAGFASAGVHRHGLEN